MKLAKDPRRKATNHVATRFHLSDHAPAEAELRDWRASINSESFSDSDPLKFTATEHNKATLYADTESDRFEATQLTSGDGLSGPVETPAGTAPGPLPQLVQTGVSNASEVRIAPVFAPESTTPQAFGLWLFSSAIIMADTHRRANISSPVTTVRVIDGYVRDAQIFLDRNRNGVADPSEKLEGITTNERGEFTLPADSLNTPVIAVGGVSVDTGQPNRVALLAPAGATVVTPLTTLAQRLIVDGKATDARDAQTIVLNSLNLRLPETVRLEDYDPVLTDDIDLLRAGVQIATLIDLAVADDDNKERQLLQSLVDLLVESVRANRTVALTEIPVLEQVLGGLVAQSTARSIIAGSLEAIGRAGSLDQLSQTQKQTLEQSAPVTPGLTIDSGSSAQSISLIMALGAAIEESTRSAATGDMLAISIFRGDSLVSEASYTLSDSDLAVGSVVLPFPEVLSVDDLRVEAKLISPTGRASPSVSAALSLDKLAPRIPDPDSEPNSSTNSSPAVPPSVPGAGPGTSTPPNSVSGLRFDYQDALTSAIFSNLAYESPSSIDRSIKSLGWKPLQTTRPDDFYLKSANAIAFAARHDAVNAPTTKFILAFKGTSALEDWGNNLVRFGWTVYYKHLMPLVAEVIDAALSAEQTGRAVELIIAGHSLGGAAATLSYADLFSPPDMNFWNIQDAPLGRAERIYQHPLIDTKWTDAQIASLIDKTTTYTFGAPSFLIDPNKLQATPSYFLKLAELALFRGLTAVLDSALTVRSGQFPALDGYAERVFQFEHINSDPWRSDDIVAQLGNRDPGTVLAVNLESSIYEKYGEKVLFGLSTVTTPIDLHSMNAYTESMLRAITGAPLLKPNNPHSNQTPLFETPASPSEFNDFLRGSSVNALEGNDILVASEAKSYRWNGGPGDDIYVVASFGAQVAIDAPLIGLDSLYFALPGSITKTDLVDSATQRVDRVLTVTSGSSQSSVTVRGWDADPDGGANALDFVGQIDYSTGKYWTVNAAPTVLL